MGWSEIVKGYLGHGVMGLVAVTMLVLYVRKDRELAKVHELMMTKMLEVGEAWRSMAKEMEEALRAKRAPRRQNPTPALSAVPAPVEDLDDKEE